jgi:hypothetical protein
MEVTIASIEERTGWLILNYIKSNAYIIFVSNNYNYFLLIFFYSPSYPPTTFLFVSPFLTTPRRVRIPPTAHFTVNSILFSNWVHATGFFFFFSFQIDDRRTGQS